MELRLTTLEIKSCMLFQINQPDVPLYTNFKKIKMRGWLSQYSMRLKLSVWFQTPYKVWNLLKKKKDKMLLEASSCSNVKSVSYNLFRGILGNIRKYLDIPIFWSIFRNFSYAQIKFINYAEVLVKCRVFYTLKLFQKFTKVKGKEWKRINPQ